MNSNLSVIVDANMGWDVGWESVDSLKRRCPNAAIVPVILQCPREVCLARIRQRYQEEPGWHGDPERFEDEHATMLWDYLSKLYRPDILFLDSNRPLGEVYDDVKAYVAPVT